ISQITLSSPSGNAPILDGLAGHPTNGTLVGTANTTHFAGLGLADDIYNVNPTTGVVTSITPVSPARRIFGDVAFQPTPRPLDIAYQEDFEDGNDGFIPDNNGGTLNGLWHLSPGRRFDALPGHTPITSWYYGAFETAFGNGHYTLPFDHAGTLSSPPILLPAA